MSEARLRWLMLGGDWSGPLPNTNSCRSDDGERVTEFSAMFCKDFSYQGSLATRMETRKADQNNAARCSPLSEHQFSKVLVCGQKQGVVVLGELEDFVVRCTRIHLGQIPNLVSRVAERLDDRPVNVLIRNEVHAAVSSIG